MPYELTVTANRKDPEERGGRPPRQIPTVSTVLVTGTLDADATAAILASVIETSERNVHSLLVEFGDVVVDDPSALDVLTHGVMELRKRGIEVQIFARADDLHARLEPLADSRDWLLPRTADGFGVARKALHLDGPAA